MPINKALAEYLELYHKGEANAVTSRELECACLLYTLTLPTILRV